MSHELGRRELPPYADLAKRPGYPPGSSWGLFGDDDEVGALNLISPEEIVRAAGLVRTGRVFPLNLDLETPKPPILGRVALRHTLIDQPSGTDDRYDSFYPQASSQWDALCHVGHPQFGYYNGVSRAEITGRPGSRLGIDRWASRGIVGRFVLADVERWCRRRGRSIDMLSPEPFGAGELDAVLAEQHIRLERGDILLIRFGWTDWYKSADPETRARLAAAPTPLDAHEDRNAFFPSPGLSPDESTAQWLWDHHVAAVAGDCPSLEVMPFDRTSPATFLHYRLIALLGIAVGEMLDLGALADDCSQDGKYEGLLVAAPLNKIGGSGSPANAVALK